LGGMADPKTRCRRFCPAGCCWNALSGTG
jgi:hypothetical protein